MAVENEEAPVRLRAATAGGTLIKIGATPIVRTFAWSLLFRSKLPGSLKVLFLLTQLLYLEVEREFVHATEMLQGAVAEARLRAGTTGQSRPFEHDVGRFVGIRA